MTLVADPAALARRNAKLQRLVEVSKALGALRSFDKLLHTVLHHATEVSEAERCSLFVLDHDRQELWSKIAQGSTDTLRFAVGKGIAGQCAATRQVIRIDDPYADPRFNPEFDRKSGFRTRSILAVPMLDNEGTCTGVLQALNKTSAGAFSAEDEELLLALGGIAAVSLQNAGLQEEIEALLEGFIRASVYAIEARDPTTSGHSERVAVMTEAVARAVNHTPPPEHRALSFTDDELREVRYAALLHDFGKVGVRENVLVKANKLYPHELALVRERFEHARARAEVGFLRRRVALLEPQGLHGKVCDACASLEAEQARAFTELDELWAFLEKCNRPTVLEEGGFERLAEIERRTFTDRSDAVRALLTSEERVNLSVAKGSLNEEERREIESHVTHTYHFLRQIPWTRSLRRVPEIAYKHHEKLTGNGYPRALPGDEIPPQTRIMTIADIYDALTATDRPYKKALPHERALDILSMEARQGLVDAALLRVFVEARAHEALRQASLWEGQTCAV